ncbi:MAG: hypothetical protein JNL94_17825, partial [Planctomycetes bacterium]|nr:hypothetical protein [Planctomycetota bacterium]
MTLGSVRPSRSRWMWARAFAPAMFTVMFAAMLAAPGFARDDDENDGGGSSPAGPPRTLVLAW